MDGLNIIGLGDIEIGHLAVRIARAHGHRARYLAYATCPDGAEVAIVGHAGFLIAASSLNTGAATTAALWDGASSNGQWLTSWAEPANEVGAATIPTTLGIAFRTGLHLTPAPGASGPVVARVEWFEVCHCHAAADHHGGPLDESAEPVI